MRAAQVIEATNRRQFYCHSERIFLKFKVLFVCQKRFLRNDIFIFLFLISLHDSLAQDFIRTANDIPVERNGEQLALPFLGGLDRFIPQFVDIDGDGDVDLFISDADGQLTLLENIGTSRTPQFRLVPDAFKDINVRNWFYFVDMESDGDPDLYHANEDEGLTFYRNNGSGRQANFVLEERAVLSFNGQPVFSQLTSIPVFADIDADRDYDFLAASSPAKSLPIKMSAAGMRLYCNLKQNDGKTC